MRAKSQDTVDVNDGNCSKFVKVFVLMAINRALMTNRDDAPNEMKHQTNSCTM